LPLHLLVPYVSLLLLQMPQRFHDKAPILVRASCRAYSRILTIVHHAIKVGKEHVEDEVVELLAQAVTRPSFGLFSI
jgi:hypothetical protein